MMQDTTTTPSSSNGGLDETTPTNGIQNNNNEEDEDENVHDQLPSLDSYKAQMGNPAGDRSCGHCMMGICFAVLCLLVGVILIVFLVLVAKEEGAGRGNDPSIPLPPRPSKPSKPRPPSTPSPSKQTETARLISMIEFISSQGWTEKQSGLTKPGTPQYKAVHWLAQTDERKLEPSTAVEFKERYALSVLYFAMDGAKWPLATQFLSKEHHCKWFGPIINGKQRAKGQENSGSGDIDHHRERRDVAANDAADCAERSHHCDRQRQRRLRSSRKKTKALRRFLQQDDGGREAKFGVALCDPTNNYVKSIRLEGFESEGHIPHEIFLLEQLKELDLSENELSSNNAKGDRKSVV